MAYGADVDTGKWQGVSTKGHPDLRTKELINLQIEVPVDRAGVTFYEGYTLPNRLADEIQPNLPWADDHFEERVGREPTNPGEQYMNWPWWRGQDASAMDARQTDKFSHTYQERFWPKKANMGLRPHAHNRIPIWGIRYQWGDLDDVVDLLAREPLTRQATFPIFFPEDTGVVHRGRVPCTLHYHFMQRNQMLHMWYPIRSCDLIRHFRDDLYMACLLMLWVLNELQTRDLDPASESWAQIRPGHLYFTAYSFHVHHGDLRYV